MNSNWDEKRIRQLFVETKLDEACRAPDFDALLEAGSRESRSDRSISFFTLAAAMAVLVLIVATAILLVGRHASRESQNDANIQPRELAPPLPEQHDERAAVREPLPVTQRSIKRRTKHVRVQRASEELAIVARSFSEWQSPTASLLKSPGEDLLKQLPKLGDSLQTLGAYSLDQLN
jgi:hypothetical protein